MSIRIKALVIGGGPAGSTAARFLAQEGIETILLEKNLSFNKPCGGGIPSSAFSEMGIPAHAIRREVRKLRIMPPQGNSYEIILNSGYLAIVLRSDFDSMLREQAKKNGALLMEAEFIRIQTTGRQITVRVKFNSHEEDIKTDYLIAADGVNSRVRSSLGMGLPYPLYTISEKIKGIDADSCEFWFGRSHAPRSYSWVFPNPEGITAGTGSYEPAQLKNLLKIFYERRGLQTGSDARIYRIPLWKGEVYNIKNMLFIGDAAGHVMPLTYEGIYHAMKSGEFAARAVIAGKPAEYRSLWKKRFYIRFFLMKRLCQYFLRNDASVEKMASIFRDTEIQEASMRLWLEKKSGSSPLPYFIKFFRRILP